MTKLISIKSFEIKGFRGGCNVKASIEEGVLILVGDNGSGKTTFLRTIFLFLSGKWSGLLKINFDSISICFDKATYVFSKEDVAQLAGDYDSYDDQMSFEFQHPYELRMMLERGQISFPDYRALIRNKSLYNNSHIPSLRRKSKKIKDVESRFEVVKKEIDAQILYLPTYRRIERELSSIFEGRELKNISNHDQADRVTSPAYVELVEFGMKDVKSAIAKNLEELKEFARKSATALRMS